MQKDPRYPIGKFDRNIIVTKELRTEFIKTIKSFPELLRKEVEMLSVQQLDTPYREGWVDY